jgi:hypothetical protein
MRPDEKYVGDRLVEFFGGPDNVSVKEGEDPPDLYLEFPGRRIGLEVTRLSQFTFESDGTFGNRATQDAFGVNLINALDAELGGLLPDEFSLLITLELPVQNAANFRTEVRIWISAIVSSPVMDARDSREIEGAKISTVFIPRRPSGKRVVGIISNRNSSADIGLNAHLLLADRIRKKNDICANLKGPIWLALLNDYWIADATDFSEVARRLRLDHCFERIFLVSRGAAVSELEFGARILVCNVRHFPHRRECSKTSAVTPLHEDMRA